MVAPDFRYATDGRYAHRTEPTIPHKHQWWWTRAYAWAKSMTLQEFEKGRKCEPIEDEV